MLRIQIRTDILSVLIWVQTVCKCNQQTTKVASSKERVHLKFITWQNTCGLRRFSFVFQPWPRFQWKVKVNLMPCLAPILTWMFQQKMLGLVTELVMVTWGRDQTQLGVMAHILSLLVNLIVSKLEALSVILWLTNFRVKKHKQIHWQNSAVAVFALTLSLPVTLDSSAPFVANCNNMDSDQTAPLGAVWSEFMLFAYIKWTWIYTQKKKFSKYLCFLIKSTILDISLPNCMHELYYCNFTCTCLLWQLCLYQTVSTKFQNTRCARAAVNRKSCFLIYCSILKENCSYCNNLEKIQC